MNINNNNEQILIITGPNMAGKSTYMRQIAMIIIMGQSGCFVPASYAEICIVDKIFTRIGAHDDLSSGKSTFMIEMLELANILNNCTNKSLILLDEIGRGTSTDDGYSIARATIEYLYFKNKYGVRTLFATHYYQLTSLCNILPKIKNYYISVQEEKNKLLFLRKIISGFTNESYGIQVAKIAGVPDSVISRSLELKNSIMKNNDKKKNDFNDIKKLLNDIKNIDIDNMKPVNAILKLFEFKNRILNIEKNKNEKL